MCVCLSVCAAEPATVESTVPLIEELDRDPALDNEDLRKQLCPYAAVGECRYGINCAYLHGDVCDMCGLQVLHPSDNTQRSEHTKVTVTPRPAGGAQTPSPSFCNRFIAQTQ